MVLRWRVGSVTAYDIILDMDMNSRDISRLPRHFTMSFMVIEATCSVSVNTKIPNM